MCKFRSIKCPWVDEPTMPQAEKQSLFKGKKEEEEKKTTHEKHALEVFFFY